MKPKDVNKNNEDEVWTTLCGHSYGGLPLAKFKIGDTVKISMYKSIFTIDYEPNFTEEPFKITKVIRGDPTVYEIEDLKGEPIIWKFYEEEFKKTFKYSANKDYSDITNKFRILFNKAVEEHNNTPDGQMNDLQARYLENDF